MVRLSDARVVQDDVCAFADGNVGRQIARARRSSAGGWQPGDIKAGAAKAMMCQACHGLDGLSKTPDSPNIAGQIEPYLVAQLQAFKSGVRKNDAMSAVVPALSDKDIEDLAAYFSAIEISVGKLPGQ